jgi:hypothetical protein
MTRRRFLACAFVARRFEVQIIFDGSLAPAALVFSWWCAGVLIVFVNLF